MLRMTLQTQLVLDQLLNAPDNELYGLEVIRQSGLTAGTVYPIMQRLERAGWVTSRWEKVPDSEQGRPARRYYKLCSDGIQQALTALARAQKRNPTLQNLLGLSPRPEHELP
jgi:DNA-binding PadR family transcriptional regulator